MNTGRFVCLYRGSVTYEAADTPELAYAGGKGIGKFQRMTSDFTGKLSDILPGFHNIRFRFKTVGRGVGERSG